MQTSINNVLILTEQKLMRMQDLDQQIKILEAEFNMLKKQVIEEYFVTNNSDAYSTSRGLVLATYTKSEPMTFSQSKFKTDFPDIYEDYKEKKVQYTFRLK